MPAIGLRVVKPFHRKGAKDAKESKRAKQEWNTLFNVHGNACLEASFDGCMATTEVLSPFFAFSFASCAPLRLNGFTL
jgi:hypothetical protein